MECFSWGYDGSSAALGIDVDIKKKKKEGCLGTCRIGRPGGKWRQPSHSNNFGAGSPPPMLTVLALLCSPGEV